MRRITLKVLGFVAVVSLVLGSCASQGEENAARGSVSTSIGAVDEPMSTVSEATTSSQADSLSESGPDIEAAAASLASMLDCETVALSEFPIVETEFAYDCEGSPTGAEFIYLFESLDQANRFMSFYKPNQLIGDERGMVAGEFTDVDEAAARIDRLTLIRNSPLGTASRPLTATEAGALYDEAIRYSDLGALWFSLHLWENIVDIDESTTPDLADLRAGALMSKAMTFQSLGLAGDAIETWDRTIEAYRDSASAYARGAAAEAALLAGIEAGNSDYLQEAIAYFDTAIEVAESLPAEPAAGSTLPDAMFGKALALHLLDRDSEAAGILQAIIDQYQQSTDPTIKSIVLDATAFLDEIG